MSGQKWLEINDLAALGRIAHDRSADDAHALTPISPSGAGFVRWNSA